MSTLSPAAIIIKDYYGKKRIPMEQARFLQKMLPKGAYKELAKITERPLGYWHQVFKPNHISVDDVRILINYLIKHYPELLNMKKAVDNVETSKTAA